MRCVYIPRSVPHPTRSYIGSTQDLKRRLKEHNSGKSAHTAAHRPWRVVVALYFADEAKAEAFERYLKHGSGHAFARRHLW